MPTRREDTRWSVVHQRSMHLRALIESLDVDVACYYELDYYPYTEVSLVLPRADAPPLVLATEWVHSNRQWEYASEYALRVVDAAIRLVESYRRDVSVRGLLGNDQEIGGS